MSVEVNKPIPVRRKSRQKPKANQDKLTNPPRPCTCPRDKYQAVPDPWDASRMRRAEAHIVPAHYITQPPPPAAPSGKLYTRNQYQSRAAGWCEECRIHFLPEPADDLPIDLRNGWRRLHLRYHYSSSEVVRYIGKSDRKRDDFSASRPLQARDELRLHCSQDTAHLKEEIKHFRATGTLHPNANCDDTHLKEPPKPRPYKAIQTDG